MDLKERLNRLTSISKPAPAAPEEKSQALGDLRQRLDRLLEPKKIYRKKAVVPIEQLVKGEVVSIPEGLMQLPNGIRVACAEVELGETGLVRVPVANLDILE